MIPYTLHSESWNPACNTCQIKLSIQSYWVLFNISKKFIVFGLIILMKTLDLFPHVCRHMSSQALQCLIFKFCNECNTDKQSKMMLNLKAVFDFTLLMYVISTNHSHLLIILCLTGGQQHPLFWDRRWIPLHTLPELVHNLWPPEGTRWVQVDLFLSH